MTLPRVTALTAVSLVTPDAPRLARFYEAALGFRVLEARRLEGPAFEDRIGAPGGALAVFLALGAQSLELLQFDRPGAPWPDGVDGEDPRFQHIAVVVSDAAAAFAELRQIPGWSPISHGEPVRLPPSSGAVTAFKFRDPDGHPAELLQFAAGHAPAPWREQAGLFQGIDHSAISVADPARSIAFYEALGLAVATRSLNVGPEQARLDGLPGAEVEVVALAPATATPHVELLAYRKPAPATHEAVAPHDIAATRLVFLGDASRAVSDPDGHRLIVLARGLPGVGARSTTRAISPRRGPVRSLRAGLTAPS